MHIEHVQHCKLTMILVTLVCVHYLEAHSGCKRRNFVSCSLPQFVQLGPSHAIDSEKRRKNASAPSDVGTERDHWSDMCLSM
jgi:hypothetical protein